MIGLWKGAISFGLVKIPVGLYSGTQRKATIDLDLLRDTDQSRIR
jgi:DNA end-binding protein Ku